ncbi:MAG: hypothetical protein GY866_14340 [Proteobacteria bacterium]|nr:hypothetical protein [Pseudomonadota bacterium]
MSLHKIALITVSFFCISILGGCSTTEQESEWLINSRRQIELKNHLRRLNRENEKMREALTKSLDLNHSTGKDFRENVVETRNLIQAEDMIERYKLESLDIQKELNSMAARMENDMEKNISIEAKMNELTVQCRNQGKKLGDMKGVRYGSDMDDKINVQIGIKGSGVLWYLGEGEEETEYSGKSAEFYLVYVGDNNLSIGLRYLKMIGDKKDTTDDTANTDFQIDLSDPNLSILGLLTAGFTGFNRYTADIGIVSLGFRIKEIETFNVVPNLLYGIGKNNEYYCDGSNCISEFYLERDIVLKGIEIPFYYNFDSSFSIGFHISRYTITSSKSKLVLNEETRDFDEDHEITIGALGIMVGFGW